MTDRQPGFISSVFGDHSKVGLAAVVVMSLTTLAGALWLSSPAEPAISAVPVASQLAARTISLAATLTNERSEILRRGAGDREHAQLTAAQALSDDAIRTLDEAGDLADENELPADLKRGAQRLSKEAARITEQRRLLAQRPLPDQAYSAGLAYYNALVENLLRQATALAPHVPAPRGSSIAPAVALAQILNAAELERLQVTSALTSADLPHALQKDVAALAAAQKTAADAFRAQAARAEVEDFEGLLESQAFGTLTELRASLAESPQQLRSKGEGPAWWVAEGRWIGELREFLDRQVLPLSQPVASGRGASMLTIVLFLIIGVGATLRLAAASPQPVPAPPIQPPTPVLPPPEQQEQLRELRRAVTRAEGSNRDLTLRLEEAEHQAVELRNLLTEARAERDRFQAKARIAEEAIAKRPMLEDYESLRESRNSERASRETLEHRVEQLQAKVVELQSALATQPERSSVVPDFSAAEVAELREEATRLSTQLEEMTTSYRQAAAEVSTLQAQQRATTAERTALEVEVPQLRADLADREQRLAALKESFDAVSQLEAEASTALASLEAEVAPLRRQVAELDARRQANDATINELREREATATASCDAAQRRCTELDAGNTSLQTQLVEVEAAGREARTRGDSLEQALAELKTASSALETDMRRQVDILAEEKAALTATTSHLKQAKLSLNKKLEKRESQVAELKAQIKELASGREILVRRIRELESALTVAAQQAAQENRAATPTNTHGEGTQRERIDLGELLRQLESMSAPVPPTDLNARLRTITQPKK